MSGAATAAWVTAGLAAAGTVASIDQAKSAKHQAALQAEQQQKEFLATQEANNRAIAAQKQMNDQNLAQAAAAAAESKALMDKQLKAADEATNRATQGTADTSRALAAAQQSSRTGASGTMLTGAQGVDASSLTLGRSTLLGQ